MNTEPTILFEDELLLVINKPAGLVVHADGKKVEPTVCDWFVAHYPESGEVGEPTTLSDGRIIKRPGIVHRLDRDTSGVLVLAKTQEAFSFLKEQFKQRTAEKVYYAFVYGAVKNLTQTIDRPIGRSKNDFRRWTAQRGARGIMRDAVTQIDVITRGADATLIMAKPKTGRTHQIRVHLKAINYPIVHDTLYAPDRPPILGFKRLALHAHSITIPHPIKGTISVVAPDPEDFIEAKNLLK
jgi:23S rRNA pseudouridine1911/1915/1917 synthase